MALADIPKITWGTSFANTLNIGFPLDSPRAWNDPREGSEWEVFPSGVRDAWLTGSDEYLAADIRWIPGATTADPVATGWDGATGFQAFLVWARDMNKFRFYPDKDSGTYHTCYLVEPLKGEPAAEGDGSYRLRIVMVDDGTQGAFTGYVYDPEP